MFGHIGIVIGLFFNGSTCVLLHTKKKLYGYNICDSFNQILELYS